MKLWFLVLLLSLPASAQELPPCEHQWCFEYEAAVRGCLDLLHKQWPDFDFWTYKRGSFADLNRRDRYRSDPSVIVVEIEFSNAGDVPQVARALKHGGMPPDSLSEGSGAVRCLLKPKPIRLDIVHLGAFLNFTFNADRKADCHPPLPCATKPKEQPK